MKLIKHFLAFSLLILVHVAQAQTVTVTAPNGGEILYACQQYPVTWTQTGTPSNYWNIDYSLDGGTIWASVTSNYLSSNGTFLWTVPNVQSNTVKLRIYDAQHPTTVDQSNNNFTINIPVLLTSPNGGEIWQGNTVHNITWNAQGTSNTYNIAYSVNGGTNWTNIITNYSTASATFAWTVPSVALSNNCLVRVMDAVTNCMQDVSNLPFTITPSIPVLLTPNGGETLLVGCDYQITWQQNTLYNYVRLDYSLDNGSTWVNITNGSSNNGYYYWSVPLTISASTQCLIRLSNYQDLSVSDVSNATFTIAPPVTVTYPNGGETLVGCATATIAWTKSYCIGTWNIAYSTNNGSTWTDIANPSDNGSPNQTYNWTVPNGITSSQALIRVRGYSYNYITDQSNAVFNIIPSNDITVTSPNGGESWVGLSSHTITWTNLPSASGYYTLQYSTNAGSSWNNIVSNITGNSYTWSVPNNPSTQCLVKVIDYQNTCKFDISNANFTIVPATPILLTPNGGETLLVGCDYQITWNQSTIYNYVRLDYSLDNGSTWVNITNGSSNNGYYYWSVPLTISASTQCLIRLSNYQDLSVSDVSDATFTIAPPVTVTYPNGGETLVGCATATIAWTKSYCVGTWNIAYSTNNGSTWTDIANPGDNGSPNQTYNWTVPNGITSSQALIRVRGYSYNYITDQSNAVFNIIPSNDITVTSPNGGESWVGLSSHTITWTNLPSASGYYTLQYSTNAGSSWNNIVSNITGNSYTWSVPNNPSTQCLVKVIDYQNTCKFDISNANFTIVPATPILLTPNGGETLLVGCDYQITWNQSTIYNYVRLDYSLDNGSTWVNITNGSSNNGYYYWSVPLTIAASTQCLIRLSNYQDLSVSDVSNATFTIAPPVTVTYPNGGETLVGCATATIAWTKSYCVGTWNIAYSTNNGSTWTDIANPSDNGSPNQTYNWTVPNGITSSQALIRVRGYSYNYITDQSNAVFNIIPSNDITVTSPNGGESWVGLSSHTITWTNLPSASGYYTLQYSTNAGSSWNNIVSNITGNSYTWSVPNNPSTQCLVKVIDYQNTCKFDISNANFTIVPATPILLTPNGGETLLVGCDYQITWTQSTIYNYVRLDYSLDNGSTWVNITNGSSNNGYYYWSVPLTISASTQCLIRLSNYQDLSVSDVSDATFTIAPPVTVTYPNGGETLVGCATATIAWTKSYCVGTWNIAYSTNNGSTWTDIANPSDNGSPNQTYNWTVPNGISSSQALIRVRGYSYNYITDQSNSVFNIIPSNDITVTSPNGGESWVGLSSHTITWTNLPSASGYYTLQYSTNAGSSWNNIVSNITGNSYTWSVPNNPSTQCLVKVIDYQNTCKFDISNANFTIVPATPILLTPNGGETLQVGCDYQITWTQSTIYNYVRLDYSLDNGSTWVNITNGSSNNGYYYWSVPLTISASTQCLIRLSNYQDLSVSDVSNATFTIAPPVSVTYPNGGETLVGCATATIAWTKSYCVGTWNIAYSTNNGSTWTDIANPSDNGSPNQTYNWTVPNGITSSQALIRVRGYSYNYITDQSNAVFNIIPSNDITVTSPNGGESWVGLSSHTITWTNLPSASGYYTLQYSTNAGSSWNNIVSNITGNSYTWSVPNNPSTQCLVKVIDYQNTCKFDISNANFTIVPATPILLTPNGGETYYSGMDYQITWTQSTIYNYVRLDYSLDGGLTWTNITNGSSNNGYYYWTCPNVSSTTALVRISNYQDLSVVDVSDAVFTIKPAVTIITPNGDDGTTLWGGCTITSITFDRSPAWSNYRIEYSTNGGSTWNIIVSSWNTSANPATYNWTMPNLNNVPTLVRVYPTSYSQYADQSDNTFTIRKPVTIIQPNFGGIMQVGTNYNIQWTSDGISNLYDIFYSTNGGTSFTNIVMGYNTSNNTYSWNVPNLPSSNCRIWVRDNVNNCKSDTSDIAFIISSSAPPITLQTPNGISDTLHGCTNKLVTWNETSTYGTYDLHYSTNGGSTWIAIVTNYATTSHQYSWVVPNINSSTVLLRVRQAGSLTNYDLSDAYFTILPGALVAAPALTTLCPGQNVQLVATGGSNYSWTPATGLNSSTIYNPIASPTASTQYIVQSNNAGCILADTVQVNVTPAATNASVSISSSPSGAICAGTSVTFTATPVNGGNASYQWKVNGSNVGTNSATFSSSSLTNNAIVTCVMTSDVPCVGTNPATSNSITMTVNPALTPAVTVSASPSTTICFGTSVTFTANVINGGLSPSYQWKLNGNTVGNDQSTYSSTSLNNNDVITVSITSNASCLTTSTANSSNTVLTVSNVPNQPGAITGSVTFCNGVSQQYSVSAVSGATSYTWTLPNGWTGTSTTNSITTTPSSTAGNITVTANNSCGASAIQTLTVNANNPPAQPGSITGSTTFCQGNSLTYSISAVSGASSYTWTLPNGWTGTSTTTSITAIAGANGGNISVTANSACGSSSAQFLNVTPNSTLPQPGAIIGSTTFCQGNALTYSISAISGATSYTWTLPNGWTGTSTTTSINATAGANGGIISVTANGSCGSSTAQTLTVSPNSTPAQPGAITGSSSFCQGDAITYSISTVGGATSYTWTLPNGWTGTSTTTSINATAGANGGIVSVTANGSCGSSTAQTLTVSPNATPAQPGSISGSSSYCLGQSLTYSIAAVSGATSYTWTLPNGWTGTSSTTSINTIGSVAGIISVSSNSTCGSSLAQTLSVAPDAGPAQPGTISGPSNYCVGLLVTYSVVPVSGATSYTWTLPNGWTGTSPTNIINSLSAGSGIVSVSANGTCGTSTAQTLNVTGESAPSQPSSISGNVSVCRASSYTYSITPVSGASSYTWNLPFGWTGSSSTDVISVQSGTSGGILSVSAVNSCGASIAQTMNVSINSPDISTTVLNNTITANQAGASYQWLDCVAAYAPISGETNQSFTAVSTGDYAVKVYLLGCVDTSSCVTMTILGMENATAIKGLNVYPNPTMDKVNIECGRPSQVRLYNSLGQLLESFMVQNSYVLQLEKYSNGVYYLQTNDSKSIKLIKQ